MPQHPPPPDADPLLAEILAIAATIPAEEILAELQEPAFVALVDRAVAPYAHVLTPKGMEEARAVATVALVSRSDLHDMLAQERARLSSGTQGEVGAEPAAAKVPR